MNRIPIFQLLLIFIIVAVALWLDQPNHPGINFGDFEREIYTHLGLDLIGGTQTLLEADLPVDTEIDPESMRTALTIVEKRVNGLGVSEAVVQSAGDRRILVELPGIEDPEEAVRVIRGTALLEFVDFSQLDPLTTVNLVGTTIETDFSTQEADPEAPPGQVRFPTVMTGADLKSVNVSTDPLGQPVVAFELTESGSEIFSEFTATHIGDVLAITLDKEVISTPVIQGQIPNGQGVIEGNFNIESANNLALQLRYGALPIPLRVVETRTVGPSLGQDSLEKSLVAGAIGLAIVMAFMALYYRLPGVIADIAILIYAAISLALFRSIPVTLTLAGFAGLILSTGSALDANILIFERFKEELRAGKSLNNSFDLGWQRAWPSIRDSNFATLITCGILFWFGSSFGATIVQGFALTLFLGVIVSLFTSIFITRTLLGTIFRFYAPSNYSLWFGM